MNTIQSEWQHYAETVLPPDAPEVQLRETRRAFYAGYLSAMMQITDIAHSVSEGNLSEDGGKGIMDGLREELADFARSVFEGTG